MVVNLPINKRIIVKSLEKYGHFYYLKWDETITPYPLVGSWPSLQVVVVE
jgi:hypothetical protein